MDLLSSVFSIYGTVSETDRQYRLMAKKLSYELKKAEHLAQTDRVKNVPKFMFQNLSHKIQQAKEHLSKIEAILTEDRISLKQKIILSLPFNKTIAIVKTCIQELQKAQQDVNEYGCSSENQNNGKRFIDESHKFQKKEQTMVSLIQNEEVNDEDIQEALMGPTIEEDAAIQFTRNRYILVRVELHGPDKIINLIKEINQEFLVYKTKLHIKFEKPDKKIDQIELFALGRVHFKPIYTKLKSVYADIDRISKQNHFVLKLKRERVNMKHCLNQGGQQKKQEKKEEAQPSKAESDEFFSFPCTDEQIVTKQIDRVVVQRSQDKSVYICDETGEWKKINELQRQICDGQQIAPFIPPNKIPQVPDLYFKIRFQVLE